MSKDKLPDQVVFNQDTQSFDAHLRPYATNVGAPAIKATNNNTWKYRNIHKANQQLKARYLEIKAQYETMLEELEYNNLVYNARFNFEPIVGEVYHLYRDAKEEPFLSIISPDECNFAFLGSFSLNSELLWKREEVMTKKSDLRTRD